MSPETTPPNTSQVTDDDLILAVQQQCERVGVPVVPTKQVAKSDLVDVTSQTVKRRLEDIETVNSIQVGRGHVWWVPEDESEVRGEIDMSSVYLDDLEPEDIPREIIEKHPDGPATAWEKVTQKGMNGFWISWLSMLAGFFIFGLGGLLPVNPPTVELISSLLLVGGFAIMIVSALVAGSGKGLSLIGASQPRPFLRRHFNKVRNLVARFISTD